MNHNRDAVSRLFCYILLIANLFFLVILIPRGLGWKSGGLVFLLANLLVLILMTRKRIRASWCLALILAWCLAAMLFPHLVFGVSD